MSGRRSLHKKISERFDEWKWYKNRCQILNITNKQTKNKQTETKASKVKRGKKKRLGRNTAEDKIHSKCDDTKGDWVKPGRGNL